MFDKIVILIGTAFIAGVGLYETNRANALAKENYELKLVQKGTDTCGKK